MSNLGKQDAFPLNEGRRQKAIGYADPTAKLATRSSACRRNNCRGIQTHQQYVKRSFTSLLRRRWRECAVTAKSEIMAGALDPKVRRKKEKSNLLRRLEQTLERLAFPKGSRQPPGCASRIRRCQRQRRRTPVRASKPWRASPTQSVVGRA